MSCDQKYTFADSTPKVPQTVVLGRWPLSYSTNTHVILEVGVGILADTYNQKYKIEKL